jgi:glycosyltransferase involved in cell wall biosynthesis
MNRVAFVTNICSHYRVRTFETLARHADVDFFFFSAGDEWYWLQEHSSHGGAFRFRYLPGFDVAGTRVTPTLPLALWRGSYDAYVKCVNGRFALPITYVVARLKRRPFILWTGIWMRLQTPAHRLLFPITRYLYRHADAVVVYGEHVRRYLESEGVPKERIFVAAHAVDNAAYNCVVDPSETANLRRALGLDDHTRVILYLGRLETGKGLPILMRSFAALRRSDVALVLAGAGSERGQLEQIARELGVADRLRFPGYIPSSDTVPYYALAWACVLPSVTTARTKETWGLVVNEAFNQGVPVIGTDAVGAAADGFLKDGVNGFVVPEGDAEALTRAMHSLLDDPDLRDAMSRRARATVAEWDNDRMVLGFRRALEHVLGSNRR